MKFFDRERRSLICFRKNSLGNFWVIHWKKFWRKTGDKIFNFNPENFVCKITANFLKPSDGPILEGGCGLGQNVYSLNLYKYNVVGIDNAKKIVKKLNEIVPSLNIKYGDVQKLSFPDNYFAGYWSLGVIEHFYNGFDRILKEMNRVLKKGGFLFITFPYMSPFRKFKVYSNLYKNFNSNFYKKYKNPKLFYQFILDKNQVIKTFDKYRFKLKYEKPLSGLKGLKEENFFCKFFLNRFLQLLYDNDKYKLIVLIKILIDKILAKFSGHIILLVFQKI